MCISNQDSIASFHDSIVNALAMARDNSIPKPCFKPKTKTIAGWNDHVEHYFRTALFWHQLWLDNVIANIRRTTRELYHKARKNVIKHQGLIASEKLAHSLEDEPIKEFWGKVKGLCSNIAEPFMGKFDHLFNCVAYDKGKCMY